MSRVATDCPLPVMQRAQREKLSFSHFCSVFPTSERVCPGSVRAAGRFRQLRHSLLCSIVLVSVETFQLYAYLLHRVCLLICSILDNLLFFSSHGCHLYLSCNLCTNPSLVNFLVHLSVLLSLSLSHHRPRILTKGFFS